MRICKKLYSAIAFTCGIILGGLAAISLLKYIKNDSKSEATPSNATVDLNKILDNKVKILCWVMTHPKNAERWKHIQYFWSKKCTKLIFVISKAEKLKNEPPVEIVGVPIDVDLWKTLWKKTREALIYIYNKFYKDFDWFVKVDDDT